jgi:hypothetical protein
MAEQLILSNNPLVLEEFSTVRAVTEPGLEAVFQEALALTQAGYRLVSAPLPPNVPLIRAPFRSLILEKSDQELDREGIRHLERARERAQVLGRSVLTDRQARDAAFIDREILLRALSESRGPWPGAGALGSPADEGRACEKLV